MVINIYRKCVHVSVMKYSKGINDYIFVKQNKSVIVQ